MGESASATEEPQPCVSTECHETDAETGIMTNESCAVIKKYF